MASNQISHLSVLMDEIGISQDRMSELTGISQGTISNLIRMKYKNPTATSLARISRVFGLSIYEVFPEVFKEITTAIKPIQRIHNK